MEQIPTEVMEKIEAYIQEQKHLVSSEGLENIRTDILFGYHLLCEGKEKEIAAFSKVVNDQQIRIMELVKRISELEAENEKLIMLTRKLMIGGG